MQKIVTVDATGFTGGLSIIGNTLDNVLIGGSGADYLFGGDGADSLTGGAGKDFFIYTSGADVITDYTAGEDVISLGAAYTMAGLSGDNYVFNFGGESSLTVNGVKFGDKLTVNVGGSATTITALDMGLKLDGKTLRGHCD